MEGENKSLRDQLKDVSTAKEEYYKRSCELDTLKVEMDRLRHYEADCTKLREQMRDMEHRQLINADKLTDMERMNESLRN